MTLAAFVQGIAMGLGIVVGLIIAGVCLLFAANLAGWLVRRANQ